MTGEQSATHFSQEELDAFARKLQDWGSQLSARERGILKVVLARAEGVEPGDVQGYLFQPLHFATLFQGYEFAPEIPYEYSEGYPDIR